jgi:hypothetical protein
MPTKQKIQIEIEAPSEIKVHHARCSNGHELCDKNVKIHDEPAIKVKVKYKGQDGLLYIDPIYGSYDNITEGIKIPKGAVVKLFCPVCDEDLTDEHETCQVCSSPMFLLHLPGESIVEGCLKYGCVYHQLKLVDSEQQLARLFENKTMESYL